METERKLERIKSEETLEDEMDRTEEKEGNNEEGNGGRKEGRTEEQKEGRKEGKKEGQKRRRKEGRMEEMMVEINGFSARMALPD